MKPRSLAQRGAITVIIVSALIIIGIAQLPKNEKADSEAALENPAARADSEPTDSLFEAAKNGTASEAKAALSAGANPDARDLLGKTPLQLAEGRSDDRLNPAVIATLKADVSATGEK